MGLYDYVKCDDPRFICSEGHDLCHEQFQTKDLGCTMGESTICDGRLTIDDGGWGESPTMPFSGVIELYCDCKQCPAFVQDGTFNLISTWVEFSATVEADLVTEVKRTSISTAEFVKSEPLKPHMRGCAGPMSYTEAYKRHVYRSKT